MSNTLIFRNTVILRGQIQAIKRSEYYVYPDNTLNDYSFIYLVGGNKISFIGENLFTDEEMKILTDFMNSTD
jgi:hypothetical protein